MSDMNRRTFGGLVAAAVSVSTARSAVADDKSLLSSTVQKSADTFPVMHEGRKPEVGMLLYPGMTLMDLLGPQTVLSTSCNVHLVWKNKELLESDSGIVLKPSTTFDECPRDLDVLFVGGGPGQIAIMTDSEVLRFMADRGARAKYVTSVCSGSLVLGAAGLLRGYEATSHWGCHSVLGVFGAKPVNARVVTDRNRITGGGVTAGIDFGLVLLSQLLGEDVAKLTQLAIEYDPQPPFNSGTPKTAGPELTTKAQAWMAPWGMKMAASCMKASKAMDDYTPLAPKG
jgi:cyclohexyl-isocyanide hydratase